MPEEHEHDEKLIPSKEYTDMRDEIERVKKSLNIDKPNADLTDDEIRSVAKVFGLREGDTTYDQDGKPIWGNKGLNAMLTITLYFFPKFFKDNDLSQHN
jgi:hypothetical protein